MSNLFEKMKSKFIKQEEPNYAKEVYHRVIYFYDNLRFEIQSGTSPKIYVFQTVDEVNEFYHLHTTQNQSITYPDNQLVRNFKHIKEECINKDIEFKGVALYLTKYNVSSPKMIHYGDIKDQISEYPIRQYNEFRKHPLCKGLVEITKLEALSGVLAYRYPKEISDKFSFSRHDWEVAKLKIDELSLNQNFVDYIIKIGELGEDPWLFSEFISRDEKWLEEFFKPLTQINELLGVNRRNRLLDPLKISDELDRLINWSSMKIHSVETPKEL